MVFARLAASLLLCLCVVAQAQLTVRVDSSTGAPRLLVNGKPVRSRIFWGAPGRSALTLKPGGEMVSFEFSPLDDEPNRATMHFRFGQQAGDIYLDDIHVVDLDTGRDVLPTQDFTAPDSFTREWFTWPTGDANTVGSVAVEPGVGRDGSPGLHVRLTDPPDGKWPDWHFYHNANLALQANHRYRVDFWAKATPERNVSVAFYRPGATYTFLGGPPGCFESQIKLAAKVGVNFVSFPCPMPWPAPGQEADWRGVDSVCAQVLRANPNALLLPRVGMDPPTWWREAHPDLVMRWEDGSTPAGAVVCSPEYRKEACERLAALVEHLEATFGDHVAGYHPCGQNTGEWFYRDTWGAKLNGYAPADEVGWRQWLSATYPDDAALQAAWGDPKVTRSGATVPSAAARHAAPFGIFRDPVSERAIIDFTHFQQQAMAELVCELAHAVRVASAGRKLVVFFYGYLFEFAPVVNGPGTSGHYDLSRVLQCPDIDVLCSPISYFDRGPGQSAPSMTAAESVALAGKLWLNEDDTATFLSSGNAPGHHERVDTLEGSAAELIRNVAQESTRNFGTWWMDLGATGWFNHAGLWAEMERLRPMDEYFLDNPTPFRPEVACVIDEESMMRVAAGGALVSRPGVYEIRRPLGRMGAPYGQYLTADVIAGRVPARMFVFATPWVLSAQQRAGLLSATRGAARIWCYAPGYFDGYTMPSQAMRELTGFDLQPVTPPQAWAEPTEAGKRLGLTAGWGIQKPCKPLFAAADATGDEVLATYPDGSAAVAWRKGPSGLSVFVGAPGISAELLRAVAREAGVHLFVETDCNVYANGPFVAVHGAADGPVTLDTARPGPVTDALTGQVVAQGPRFTIDLRKNESRVFRY